MLPLKLIILDTPFTPLTVQSMRDNLPNREYTVVSNYDCDNVFGEALDAADGEMSFVVLGGVILEPRKDDLPPMEELDRYHLCAAQDGVFVDDPKVARFYDYVDSDVTPGKISADVFIINPRRWKKKPKRATGVLRNKRVLHMPRYMNHKHDVLIDTCVSPYQALEYGMLGAHASVFNYIPLFNKTRLSVLERWAYRFDKVLEYVDLLPDPLKTRLTNLAMDDFSEDFRDSLGEALGIQR